MKKNILLVLAILLIALSGNAQQNPMYSQYMFNQLVINPAYAGSREVINLTALHRNQWYNINGAPKTTTFSADAPVASDKVGIGLSIMHDRIGVTSSTDIAGYFAYRIKFQEERTLAFGLSAIVTQFNVNLASLDLNPDGGIGNDPAFASNINKMLPNFGGGIYYNSKRFFAGLSVPTFLTNRISADFTTARSVFARQFQHFFFIAGGLIDITSDIKWKPSILYKAVSGAPMQMDFNSNVWFYDVFAVGVSYRSFDAISFLAEVQATPQLRFGYAYDRSFNLTFNRTGSHEIMLNYMFGYGKGKIMSPRYF